MQRVGQIQTIWKKELVDFVRDWRTLAAMILVPIIIFPVIFVLLPLFLQGEAAELAQRNLYVEVQTGDGVDPPLGLLAEFSELQVLWVEAPIPGEVNFTTAHDERERIQSGLGEGTLHAILRIAPSDGNATENWDYIIFKDSTDELSMEATSRTEAALDAWEDEVINLTLSNAGLERADVYDPIHRDADGDIADAGEQSAMGLALFVPLVVALWTASAAIQPAIDITAGERERGTMEALLCTPVRRQDLLTGKWLAVATVAVIGVLMQMAGLLVAISYLMPAGLGMPKLDPLSIVLLLISVVLFTIFVVAIELAIAVRAHSVKEAGATLGPLIMVFIGPTLFSQFVNLEGIELAWFAAPIFNVTLAMREAFLGIHNPTHIAIWMTTSLFYALGAVYWASRQFNREDLVESLS